MEYAGLRAGISSWWGRGAQTDRVFKRILKVSAATSKTFHWSVYYEGEAYGDPSVAQIRSDLHYLKSRYWNQPSYLHIRKRPAIQPAPTELQPAWGAETAASGHAGPGDSRISPDSPSR